MFKVSSKRVFMCKWLQKLQSAATDVYLRTHPATHMWTSHRNASHTWTHYQLQPVRTHSHEGSLGLQDAGPKGDVMAFEGVYGEAYGLRHGEDNGQQPDYSDLYRRYRGNAVALNPGPGRHSTIPANKVKLCIN